MTKQLIVGAVLVLASFGAGAADAPTIQELRAKRAALEKTIATATAELREVNAAIAKLGKVDALPANYIEEVKDKLTAAQYEAVKGVKFGGIAVAAPGNRSWSQGVYIKAPSPTPVSGLTAHCRFLVRDANSDYRVIETDSDLAVSGLPPIQLRYQRVSAAWLGKVREQPVLNAHLVISMHGTPVYEALWRPEKAPISPNGIPWWRDDLLTGGLPLSYTLRPLVN